MSETGAGAGVSTLFDGPGEFRALLRSTDWSTHPLGAPDTWPSRLLTLVDVCAGSAVPMALWWEPSSPRRLVLCNDACGDLLGRDPGPDVDPVSGLDVVARPDVLLTAAWPGLDALVDRVVETGREAARDTLSVAPVRDADGAVVAAHVTMARPVAETRGAEGTGLLDHVLRLVGGSGPVALTRADADELLARVRARERASAQAETRVANLEAALRSNRRIGQAIGVLMAGRRITEEQAFELLREHSQHTQRKLREVAEDVTFTGDLPPRAGGVAADGARP